MLAACGECGCETSWQPWLPLLHSVCTKLLSICCRICSDILSYLTLCMPQIYKHVSYSSRSLPNSLSPFLSLSIPSEPRSFSFACEFINSLFWNQRCIVCPPGKRVSTSFDLTTPFSPLFLCLSHVVDWVPGSLLVISAWSITHMVCMDMFAIRNALSARFVNWDNQ